VVNVNVERFYGNGQFLLEWIIFDASSKMLLDKFRGKKRKLSI
jgi:hypothetical protein